MEHSAFNFPLDIWYHLSSTLASDQDYDTLKVCSLTCKTLYALCARHIYKIIDINNYPWDSPEAQNQGTSAGRFAGLLTANPTIAIYVKRFYLHFKASKLENADVCFILDKLHHVDYFFLCFDDEPCSWNIFPEPLKHSLRRFMQSTDLTTFMLQSIADFPAVLISQLTHLQNLAMVYTVTLSVDGMDCRECRLPRLRSFRMGLRCWKAVDQFFLHGPRSMPVDLSAITNLQVDHIQTASMVEERFLECFLQMLPSIQNLEISVISGSHDLIRHFRFSKSLNPSSRKTLRTLKLCAYIRTADEDPYAGACEELECLAADKPPLEDIQITINLHLQVGYICTTRREVWGKLNAVLKLSKFPLLKTVSINVFIVTPVPADTALLDGLRDVAEFAFRLENIALTFEISEDWLEEYNGAM